MAQRSITSFFSKPKDSPTSVTKAEKENVKLEEEPRAVVPLTKVEVPMVDDSPIKRGPSKKRIQVIDSDEDSSREAVNTKKRKPSLTSSDEASASDEEVKQRVIVKLPQKKAKNDTTPKKVMAKKSTPVKEESPAVVKSPKSPASTTEKNGDAKDIRKNKESKSLSEAKTSSPSVSNGKQDEGTAVENDYDVSKYDPLKSDYHPLNDAKWRTGERVPYMALARTLECIEATSSRLKMIEILANYLRTVSLLSPDDMVCSVYLCLNQLAPAYVGLELGVGETIIIKALAQATGRAPDKVKADAAAKGDLGLVAEASKGTQKTLFNVKRPSLTIRSVFDKLTEIASMTGNASGKKKVDTIHGLLVSAKQLEARYIVRSLAGKLRTGLAEQSLLQALAQAATLTPPNQPSPPTQINCLKGLSPEAAKAKIEANAIIIKTAYCQCPSYDRIISCMLRDGVAALPEHCTLTPGIPLKPMLACPTRGIGEVLQRFDSAKFTCEWKYDGERAQIHLLEGGDIRIYSRNQENNTSKYPDIIARFKSWISSAHPVTSAIIDTEAVAWDVEKKQILPFQVLSTRKRKDAVESDIKVQVCVYAFDLLYINGESMVEKPLAERRRRLWESFHPVDGQFAFATSRDPETTEEIEEFLDESLKGHCEGLMVKGLVEDATYEIAKRSKNWLKLKKDYLDGVGDTIDAVVIGGYLGKGKRTGLYGGFLLACYDESNEEYQSLCKIGTGFSDEDFQKHSEFFKNHVSPKAKPYYCFDQSLAPDHWFEPVQVWEIKCADLSISPVHRAGKGIVDPVKGISLRFPRFLRIREDKGPENATTAEQIAELYSSQEQVKNRKGITEEEEEGFY